MKQFDLRDLATHIHVALTCMPKTDRNAGGWRGEQAVRSATAKIMKIFEGGVVLLPDQVVVGRGGAYDPVSYGPGKFGVTEPWPFEPGCRPPNVPKPPGGDDAA